MGVVLKTDIRTYWSTDPIIASPIFNDTITRERFECIMMLFHLNDNVKQPGRGEPNVDKLYKTRPLWDH